MNRRVVIGLLAGLLALMLGVATALASSPHSNINDGVETQTEAGPHVFTPSSTPCVETLASDATFTGYYDPYLGTYNPDTCPGPWSKVVMTVTGSVNGVQYDRLLDVEVGHAMFLHGSTSEPDGLLLNTNSAIQWSVQRDVTQYSSLLTQSQPVEIALDTVVTSTYTGVYGITVTLSFYPVTSSNPAPDEPNVILPVTQSGAEPMFNLTNCSTADEQQGEEVTFPTNLDRLQAELFASGGGTEEEFWWLDPENDGVSSPYREVDVYIDGKLAGGAVVFPSTFTGFNGPDFWEPIPSPRAWDLVPYVVDLTPFIGELSDGLPHDITLGVANAAYTDNETASSTGPPGGCGTDYWKVAANLEGWTDRTAAVTGGTVSTETNATAPAEDVTTDPTGQNLFYADDATHNLTFAGTVNTGSGADTVTVNDDMSETADETPETEIFDYGWDEASTTTLPSGTVTVSNDDHTYGANAQIYQGDYEFTDDDAQDDTSGTTTTFTSTTAEQMQTQDAAGEGGALAGGTQADVEDECWTYSDSSGESYQQQIEAAGGEVLNDSFEEGCANLPTLNTIMNPFATTTGTTTTGTTTTGTTTTGTTTSGTGTGETTASATTPSGTATSGTTSVASTTTGAVAPSTSTASTTPTVTSRTSTTPNRSGTTKAKTKGCTPPRRLRFPQHPAAPVREIVAKLYLDGRLASTTRGRRITALALTRPTAKAFSLEILATLSDGEVVAHYISYAGCEQTASTTKVLHHASR